MASTVPAKGTGKSAGKSADSADGAGAGVANASSTPAPAAPVVTGGKGAPAAPPPPFGGAMPPPPWTADINARAFFFPLENATKLEGLNQKGTSEDDAFRLLDEVWCFLDAEGILKPGKRGNLLPYAGNREQRQALRLSLICGLVLDQVDDSFSEIDSLSTAGSESIADFLRCVRENRKKDLAGEDSAFHAMVSKFISCLSPDGDLRHAATFANEANLAEGSPEYSAALKLHIAAAVDKEKKEKIKASKNELFTIIQSEFPQHIQFLSSSTVEAREQVVQQVAQRHSEIAKRLEDLKSLKAGKASVPGVSQDLAALMQGTDASGGSLLDALAKIREQLTGGKSLGRDIQADVARMASIMGRYAVRALDNKTKPSSEEALALQRAISAPQALLTGSETAALELFTSTKQRSVARSGLQTLKAAQVFLGKSDDLSGMVVDVYLRHLTTEGKPLLSAQCDDIFDLMPGLFLRPRPTEAAAEDNRSRIEISAYSGNGGEQPPPEGLIVNRLAVEAVKEAHGNCRWIDEWLTGKLIAVKGGGKGKWQEGGLTNEIWTVCRCRRHCGRDVHLCRRRFTAMPTGYLQHDDH